MEMVDEVTTPRPAAVSAATCSLYAVVEVRPVSWYCRVELDRERSSRLDSKPDTSHHSMYPAGCSAHAGLIKVSIHMSRHVDTQTHSHKNTHLHIMRETEPK